MLALWVSASAWAGQPQPDEEQRLRTLSAELRCLVCQNQSLADSNAELAVDLRNQVQDLMRSGKSDQEIKDYLVQRYGDFVLYRPPVKSSTVVLWIGPFVLLALGAVAMLRYVRSRRRTLHVLPITDDRLEAARQLLVGGDEVSGTQRKDDST